MATRSSSKIRIRWVRSGIAFNRNQKEIVRSLGLRRLHHVVERDDNAVVRGLVAKISHLVEVLEETKPSVWTSVPEYTVVKPESAAEATSREEEAPQPAAEAVLETSVSVPPEDPVAEPEAAEPPSSEPEGKAPRKRQKKSARTQD